MDWKSWGVALAGLRGTSLSGRFLLGHATGGELRGTFDALLGNAGSDVVEVRLQAGIDIFEVPHGLGDLPNGEPLE